MGETFYIIETVYFVQQQTVITLFVPKVRQLSYLQYAETYLQQHIICKSTPGNSANEITCSLFTTAKCLMKSTQQRAIPKAV